MATVWLFCTLCICHAHTQQHQCPHPHLLCMVSCSFLVLSCMACFLFPSVVGGISQLLFITAYLILFFTYQDTNSPGTTYYGFLSLGLATLAWVHLFFFLFHFFWLLMLTNLQSLSWRTFFASLFGVATPYVLLLSWGFFSEQSDALY